MRVLVAGGSGVIGRGVVSALVARGHQVSATTTDSAKLQLLRRLGAEGHVMHGLDPLSVGEVVAAVKPDVIVNQMTGLSGRHAGKPNPCWLPGSSTRSATATPRNCGPCSPRTSNWWATPEARPPH